MHALRGSSSSESAAEMGENGISGSAVKIADTGALGVGGISTGRTGRKELQTVIGMGVGREKGLFCP